jgi:hypothetical protein
LVEFQMVGRGNRKHVICLRFLIFGALFFLGVIF